MTWLVVKLNGAKVPPVRPQIDGCPIELQPENILRTKPQQHHGSAYADQRNEEDVMLAEFHPAKNLWARNHPGMPPEDD